MPRQERLKIILEGELARALSWEAERRGVRPQGLARELLASSGADILELWRDGHRKPVPAEPTPTREQVREAEAVVRKSYAPAVSVDYGQPAGGAERPRRSREVRPPAARVTPFRTPH